MPLLSCAQKHGVIMEGFLKIKHQFTSMDDKKRNVYYSGEEVKAKKKLYYYGEETKAEKKE